MADFANHRDPNELPMELVTPLVEGKKVTFKIGATKNIWQVTIHTEDGKFQGEWSASWGWSALTALWAEYEATDAAV